ncbi:MAG: hypothetical protein H0T79_22695, partial [Deltaproteobacteria bacterium]|nr:hypothetical protein [Deltaproteobacteria bacterium]
MRFLLVGLLITTACEAVVPATAEPAAPPDASAPGAELPTTLMLSSSQFNARPNPTTELFTSLVFRNPRVTAAAPYAPTRIDGCYISDCLTVPYVDGVGIDVGTISVTDNITTLSQTPRASGFYVPAAKPGT